MSDEIDPLVLARKRIRDAYDPRFLQTAGERLAELLGGHLAAVEQSQKPVLNWEEPEVNRLAAESALKTFADGKREKDQGKPSAQLLRRFTRLVETMLDHGNNLHDPRYTGHQVPASIPLAGWFDAVGSVTNQVGAIYEMGPWVAATEAAVVQALGAEIGLSAGEFAGVITHGGSLANLTALLTARNVTLGESWQKGVAASERSPLLVSHAEAHYCIARSAGILGLGTEQVVQAELDDRRRIDPRRLDEQLARLQKENRPVIAVVACACATPIGAFDPLEQIADVCENHGVWLHVDAAHGGATCFSSRYRHLIAGLERADSFICDAHKMLFVPALCAFVFYRNKAHRFEAFQQDAPYLFDPSAPGLADFDGGLKTVECTRRAAAYGLWGVWSLFGPQLFADMVDVTFDLGRRFYEMLAAADDFQPLHEPECNIVAFRHTPRELDDAPPERLGRFQLDLRRNVIESGESYLVPTQKENVAALRVTIINPLTTVADLERLLQTLRDHGRQLLNVP